MQSHWYGGLERAKITGNRLVVFVDLLSIQDLWSVVNDRTVRFDNRSEARSFAKRNGFTDGLKFVVARGFGLKPRIDRLTGGK